MGLYKCSVHISKDNKTSYLANFISRGTCVGYCIKESMQAVHTGFYAIAETTVWCVAAEAIMTSRCSA